MAKTKGNKLMRTATWNEYFEIDKMTEWAEKKFKFGKFGGELGVNEIVISAMQPEPEQWSNIPQQYNLYKVILWFSLCRDRT